MRHLRQIGMTTLLCAVLSACGGSSPTAPTPPQYPQVAGTYRGSITLNVPEISQSITCPASTVVSQSGNTVSLAPIVLTGTCNNFSIPLGSATMDTTGALVGQNTGSFFEPTCGGNYAYTISGGFFGAEFRLSMNATSGTCYNLNFTAVLTR